MNANSCDSGLNATTRLFEDTKEAIMIGHEYGGAVRLPKQQQDVANCVVNFLTYCVKTSYVCISTELKKTAGTATVPSYYGVAWSDEMRMRTRV